MAYDANAVIAEGAARAGAPSFVVGMTEPQAYAGVTGTFRLVPDGHVKGALAVKAVNRKRPSVVSPAPPSPASYAARTGFCAHNQT